LIGARFPNQVTADVERRVAEATLEQLKGWIKQFARATTLEQVFAE